MKRFEPGLLAKIDADFWQNSKEKEFFAQVIGVASFVRFRYKSKARKIGEFGERLLAKIGADFQNAEPGHLGHGCS